MPLRQTTTSTTAATTTSAAGNSDNAALPRLLQLPVLANCVHRVSREPIPQTAQGTEELGRQELVRVGQVRKLRADVAPSTVTAVAAASTEVGLPQL